MTMPTPADAQLRRLFASLDVPVEPPPDLATRLRLRVLAEAEVDAPFQPPAQGKSTRPAVAPGVSARLSSTAMLPVLEPEPPLVPASLLPPPSSRPDDVGRRRRQPRWLVVLETAAMLLLLLGAAAAALRFAGDRSGGAPALGHSITAVAGPSAEPQLLWERTDPDLQGVGDLAAGDDLLVRSVFDEHKSGFLWFEHYEYETFVQALDRGTGELRWQVPVLAGNTGYVNAAGFLSVTDSAVLYVTRPDSGNGRASLVALSQADGSQLWRTELPDQAFSITDLVVTDDLAILATSEAQVRAFDLTSGAEVWETSFDAPQVDGGGVAPTLVLDGNRVLTLDPTGAVVELDAASGAVVSRRPATVTLPTTVYDGRLVATDDRLVTLVTGTDDAVDDQNGSQLTGVLRISATDRTTGDEVWSTELDGDAAITSADDLLLLSRYSGYDRGGAGTLQALDLRTGAEVWTAPLPTGYPMISSDAAISSDGQVLFGSETGEIVSLDLATGAERWRYRPGSGTMTPPTVTGGLAIVSDRPDHLLAIALPENDR